MNDFSTHLSDIIGLVGVALILSAYSLLQLNRLRQDSVVFSLVNTVGSFFIIVSLYFSWNLASVVIEISWFLISTIGLTRAVIKQKCGHYHG